MLRRTKQFAAFDVRSNNAPAVTRSHVRNLDVATAAGIVRVRLGGNGSPTVVLMSGLGDGLNVWSGVMPLVAGVTTVISYDRLGIGRSMPTRAPRDAATLATELRDLLTSMKAREPVILAAHSAGAFIARWFAHSYHECVAGLAFIEPSHEDWLPNLRERDARAWKTHMTWRLKARHSRGRKAELAAWEATVEEMRRIGPALPAVPITILSAIAGHTSATCTLFDLHRRWISNLPGARHVITEAAGHYVHREAPEIVADVIGDLVEQVRHA